MSDVKQIVSLEKKEKKKGAGRPRKVPIRPTSAEAEQLQKNKKRHMENDSLVQAISKNPDSLNMLDIVMTELAKESSSLDFERLEAERKGEDTTNISSKKIGALKAVMDTYFKKRETIVNDMFDFKDKKFEKLFEFFLIKFRNSCEKADMSPEAIQDLFRIAGEEFSDWQKEAIHFIKNNM